MPSPTETTRGVEWHCTGALTGVRAGLANGGPHWNYTCIMRQDQMHPTVQCTVASKAMHVEDIFQKQVLNFNLSCTRGFPLGGFIFAKNPVCTLSSGSFIRSFCVRNMEQSELSQSHFHVQCINPLHLLRNKPSYAS